MDGSDYHNHTSRRVVTWLYPGCRSWMLMEYGDQWWRYRRKKWKTMNRCDCYAKLLALARIVSALIAASEGQHTSTWQLALLYARRAVDICKLVNH